MKLAFYDDNKDNEPAAVDASWPELVALLSDVRMTACNPCSGKDCPHKYGAAWSPVDIDGKRANANVRAVTVAVFDIDNIDDDQLQGVAESIEGFEYVFHATHTPGCYRLVMPLSRDVAPSEWRTFLRTAVVEMKLPADPACKDLSRLYFLPTCPTSREPLVEIGSGVSLDVDAMLALASQHGTTVHALPDPIEPPTEDEATDLDSLRGALARARRRKAGSTNPADVERYEVLGRVLKGEPLAQPGARDTTINQAAALLAFVLPLSTPEEAVTELLRASMCAMVTEPEGIDYWQGRAVRSFTRAVERRREQETQRAEAQAVIRERMLGFASKREPARAAASGAADEGESDDEEGEAEQTPDAWKVDLIMRADGTPKACGENVVTILARSPETRGTFAWDEVTKRIVVRGGPFADVPQEVLDTAVTDWLQRHYGLSLGTADVGARIMRVARMNAFDPLRDYLLGLRWDGVSRAASFLTHYCDAVTVDDTGKDITEHLERVGARWLISCVARALVPGCQVDTVLVLEGKQGNRKTSALRVMGGEWFAETQLVLGDKDTEMLAATSWIVELAELASLRRTETNAQKAWITKRKARIRLPYGRTLVDLLRRCVLVGTVNPDDGGYLNDRTGNRRYWPVLCGAAMYQRKAELELDRDQLWAEAVALYKAGEPWWLSEDEQEVADGLAEERLGENVIEARIAEWWYGMHPSKRSAEVTTHGIAEQALGLPFERLSARGVTTEVGIALRRLGFHKTRKTRAGRLAYIYEATKEMRDAPQGSRPSHLRLVLGIATDKTGQG